MDNKTTVPYRIRKYSRGGRRRTDDNTNGKVLTNNEAKYRGGRRSLRRSRDRRRNKY